MVCSVKGIQTRAARRNAARVPSGQSGSNGRLWDDAPPAAACRRRHRCRFYGGKLFICAKLLKLFAERGEIVRERESRVPIKSHMKGESVSIVCPVSVNTAGYLLRQFGLSTSDTQRRPSWDSNLLVTSLLL